MEALGWIYAQARRTHARARQGMHERGAPPGGPRIYLKSRGVFGGPGGAPPSCAPRFARARLRLPRAQTQPNGSIGVLSSRFTPVLNGCLSVLSFALFAPFFAFLGKSKKTELKQAQPHSFFRGRPLDMLKPTLIFHDLGNTFRAAIAG